MTLFALSQLLAGIAIGFDLLSFQFKERRQIIACLIVSCLLIATHFALLGLWTAMGLGLLAVGVATGTLARFATAVRTPATLRAAVPAASSRRRR